MDEREALIALNFVSGIGGVKLKRLLDYFFKPQDIFRASSGELSQVSGINPEICRKIKDLNPYNLDKELATAARLGLKIITLADADYPKALLNIDSCPIVLYCKGALKEEDASGIAVVGSRKASLYGLSCSEKFAFDLACCGLTIISGMASGIDTTAHKAALKAGGRTVAVMGSGFNQIYPKENKELVDKISASGSVISEFPIDTLPLKYNFPRRNRIISGLSRGVLVVEASLKSGALITADFALEQGKDVFVIPGKIDSFNSCGSNGLIKQGAKLVSDINDILQEFGLEFSCGNIDSSDPAKNRMDKEENVLYDAIDEKGIFIDDLVSKTDFKINKVFGLLFKLQLKKLIKQLPGRIFARSNQE
ncbi:MAG: DNA-protecting protein DprA [Candidatus Omnitrophota bacterium]|jgi:DNA processing protein|nr:MAG: DNA-protecting protein DprA [Candidatus Omnitrophota bacterium]